MNLKRKARVEGFLEGSELVADADGHLVSGRVAIGEDEDHHLPAVIGTGLRHRG